MVQVTYKKTVAAIEALIGPVDDSVKGRRRLRIVEAASELFCEQGYRKTSMDEVARRAAMSKVTVYGYFPAKINLLASAIGLEKKRYLARFAAMFDPKQAAEDRLRLMLLSMLTFGEHMPLASKLVRGDEMATVIAEIPAALAADSQDLRLTFMGDLIAEVAGEKPSAVREETDVFTGLAYFASALAQDHVRQGLSIQRFAEVLVELLVSGVKSKKKGHEKGQEKGKKR
jgi:AcrR family transcriptional regulator